MKFKKKGLNMSGLSHKSAEKRERNLRGGAKPDLTSYDKNKTMQDISRQLHAAQEKLARMEADGTATEAGLKKMREIVANLSATLKR